MVNFNNRNNDSKGVFKFGKDKIGALDASKDEEDKYSVTVKAGNKVIEKTEEQVIQNAKTIRKIMIRGKVENPDSSSSEYSQCRSMNFNVCYSTFE